jgi:carboxypeptidase Q
MRRGLLAVLAALTCAGGSTPAAAQTWAVNDPVLSGIWQHGMVDSRIMRIGQTLMDSVGPRLAGSPGHDGSVEWSVGLLRSWGVDARAEQYGTWQGWQRGITHIDLLQPWVRTLEGMMLAYSPGTGGRPVQAPVVAVPEFASAAELDAWLPSVRGRFVAISYPQPTCRPNSHYEQFGQQGALERLNSSRREAQQRFAANRPATNELRRRLEQAGAVGILESDWSGDLGTHKVHGTNTSRIPTVALGCEDYGLVFRLAANGQGPVMRLVAESRDLGEVPVHNVVGMIRGSERPDEYIVLSAHLDSWDGGTGAADNGTGTITMLETIRILREVYPQPKRSIVIGLWGGEEQGLNGSRGFVRMHPEIVDGIHALFNQDNGTGRVVNISMQGFTDVGAAFGSWLARIPQQITSHISLQNPGFPAGGSSDHAAFVCAGAPAFNLSSNSWNYGAVTWHTNRDTFDKIVEEEMRNNATLTAMLVYLAAEHPERLPRARREMGTQSWPVCRPGTTQSPRSTISR